MLKEAFLARGGINRKNKDYIIKRYKRRANATRFVSYDLQPWLMKLVDNFGYDKSKQLLKGVGNFNVIPEPNEKTPPDKQMLDTEHVNQQNFHRMD